MFRLLPTRDEQTIAVEIKGKPTKEDAEKMNQFAEVQFNDDQPFNIYAEIEQLDRPTLEGIMEGMKVDAKRWNQFSKFAVVSDENWISVSAKMGDILPGVTVKHFNKEEQDKAWNWIQKSA